MPAFRQQEVRDYLLPGIAVEGSMSMCQVLDGMRLSRDDDDRGYYGWCLEILIGHLLSDSEPGFPVLRPILETADQRRINEEWHGDERANWETADENILDSIRFEFCGDWRERYGEIPRIKHVSI